MSDRCSICGYDLHGLGEAGDCPECGTPIAKSRLGDRLAAAEPHWLRTIVRGQRVITIAPFVAIAAVSLVFITGLVRNFMPGGLSGTFGTVIEIISFIARWGALGGLFLITVGVFLITVQEPRETFEESLFSSRRLARVGMTSALVAFNLSLIDYVLVGPLVYWSITFATLQAVTLTVAVAATLRWLAHLAGRIPNTELEDGATKSARLVSWAIPCVMMFEALEMLVRILPAQTSGWRDTLVEIAAILLGIFGCFVAVLVIVLLIHVFALIGLMAAFDGAFRECWRTAEALAVGDDVMKSHDE